MTTIPPVEHRPELSSGTLAALVVVAVFLALACGSALVYFFLKFLHG